MEEEAIRPKKTVSMAGGLPVRKLSNRGGVTVNIRSKTSNSNSTNENNNNNNGMYHRKSKFAIGKSDKDAFISMNKVRHSVTRKSVNFAIHESESDSDDDYDAGELGVMGHVFGGGSNKENGGTDSVRNGRIKSMLDYMSFSTVLNCYRKDVEKTFRLDASGSSSFSRCFVLSIPVIKVFEHAKGNLLPSAGGSRYFDAFRYDDSSIEYMYTSSLHRNKRSESNLLDPEDLTQFFFPNGGNVRVLPKRLLTAAERLGLCGPNADKYQLLTLTDEHGVSIYGISIVVTVEMSSDHAEICLPGLKRQRRIREAGNKIAKFISKHWPEFKEKQNNIRRFDGLFRYYLGGNSNASNRGSGNGWSSSKSSLSRNEKQRVSKLVEPILRSRNPNDQYPTDDVNELLCTGDLAHRKMLAMDNEESVILVEKGFVLLNVKKNERILLFGALQRMIDSERTAGNLFMKSDDASQTLTNLITTRHEWMTFMKFSLLLEGKLERHATISDDHLSFIRGQNPKFVRELLLGEGVDAEKIRFEYSLPLPMVEEDFGFAQLLIQFPPIDLIHTLQLLLIETSVLVIGSKSESVCTTTSALIELLQPYEWCGTFLNLIPIELLDMVSSPVPFVAGMIVDDDYLEKFLRLDVISDAQRDYLSILDFRKKKIQSCTNPDIIGITFTPPFLLEALGNVRSRLLEYRDENEADSCLTCFKSFIQFGFPPRISLALQTGRKLIRSYMNGLAQDLQTTPDGYKHYGLPSNEDDRDFYFYPSKYTAGLAATSTLTNSMANTQMFVAYVDKRRYAYDKNLELIKSQLGKELAKWIWKRWKMYKYNKLKNTYQ